MISLWIVLCAGVLLALSASHFATASWFTHASSRSISRGREATAEHRRSQAQLARLEAQLNLGDHAAVSWQVLQVAEIVQESEDCRSFYLVDPNRQPLASFSPGQYVMVRPALARAFQTTRCYSISSAPDPRFWRITVKQQESLQAVREQPAQLGLSKWLHGTIRAGDFLLVSRPLGEFVLDEESRRSRVMIAAGVGITPLASMLRRSLESAVEVPVHLYFQARSPQYWPLGETLHVWQAGCGNLQVASCFSQVDAHDLRELRRRLPGRISAGYLDASEIFQDVQVGQSISTSHEADYYLCGPDAWMQKMRNALRACGVDAQRLHWESFGADAHHVLLDDTRFRTWGVRFERSQLEAHWDDPQQSLWELARQNGVGIPSGCMNGVCGTCRIKVLSGKVEYLRVPRVPAEQGECLACVARPASELVLDI